MKKVVIILSAVISFAACSPMESVEMTPSNQTAKKNFTPMVFSNSSTKLSVGTTGSTVSFYWDEGDAIGIFANSSNCTSNNVTASISEGIGSNTGIFTTTSSIELTEGETNELLVYYPHNRKTTYSAMTGKIGNIALASTQIQSAANNSAHLGLYDFGYDMEVTSTSAADPVTFTLHHALTQLRLSFVTEKYTNYSLKSMTLTTDEDIALAATSYAVEIISNTESNITDIKGGSNAVTVSLTTPMPLNEAGQLYMTLLPANMVDKSFKYTVVLVDADNNEVVLNGARAAGGHNLTRSKMYSMTMKLDTYTEGTNNDNSGNGNNDDDDWTDHGLWDLFWNWIGYMTGNGR